MAQDRQMTEPPLGGRSLPGGITAVRKRRVVPCPCALVACPARAASSSAAACRAMPAGPDRPAPGNWACRL